MADSGTGRERKNRARTEGRKREVQECRRENKKGKEYKEQTN